MYFLSTSLITHLADKEKKTYNLPLTSIKSVE